MPNDDEKVEDSKVDSGGIAEQQQEPEAKPVAETDDPFVPTTNGRRQPDLNYPSGYGRVGVYDDALPPGPISEPRIAFLGRVGRFLCFKSGRYVGYESGHEQRFMRVLTLEPRVVSISRPAEPLEGFDGRRIRRYTPDCKADLSDGSCRYFEVKPEEFQRHPRIAEDLSAIARLMSELGLPWSVVPPKVYDDAVLQSVARELNAAGRLAFIDPEMLGAARRELEAVGTTTPRRLSAASGMKLGAARRHLFNLVSWGHARLDRTRRLDADTEVYVA